MEEFAFILDNNRRELYTKVWSAIYVYTGYTVSVVRCVSYRQLDFAIGLLCLVLVECANLPASGNKARTVGQDRELWSSWCQFRSAQLPLHSGFSQRLEMGSTRSWFRF